MAATRPKDPFEGVAGPFAVLNPLWWETPSALSDSAYLDHMAIIIKSNAAGTLSVICADPDETQHEIVFNNAGDQHVGRFIKLRSTDTATITAGDLEVGYIG